MKGVGFGIIGFGRQGLRLAEHIRKDIQPGKLIAVCRRSADGCDYSRKHGIKFYSNYHDLLKDKDIHAVIITTPSNLHGLHALDVLKSGRHVLIDKPIASSFEEGLEIQSYAKKEKLTVAVNFPLRVNPVTEILRRNLPAIGRLIKIHVMISHGPARSAWQSDMKLSNGGVILDLGSHYFDLISFLTGCRPAIIETARSEKMENEDSGFIDLTYENFSVSVVLLRNQKFRKNIITCAGDKGFLFADYSGREVIISNNHEVNKIQCPASYDFEKILNNLVRAINEKDAVIADAEAGLGSLRTVLSVYKAIRTGTPARL
ncbi:MAG: Gfo/Idh/MocA family oxidoreductase [Nitrospirae bacterium]|nr:Gfo/Idh/MocA family oxidoreductase [Nitrospirota bacterium]